jgi:hypothetical protein
MTVYISLSKRYIWGDKLLRINETIQAQNTDPPLFISKPQRRRANDSFTNDHSKEKTGKLFHWNKG